MQCEAALDGADAAFLAGPAHSRTFPTTLRGRAFKKGDDARDFPEHAAGRAGRLRDTLEVHRFHDDLTVGLRVGRRRIDFIHALRAAPVIGERAVLSETRCAGNGDDRKFENPLRKRPCVDPYGKYA
jgi:hypothetical protein